MQWGVILILSLICVAVISYTSITRFPLIVFAGPVIVWLIFFWIGVFLSRSERNYKIGWIFVGVFISFSLKKKLGIAKVICKPPVLVPKTAQESSLSKLGEMAHV